MMLAELPKWAPHSWHHPWLSLLAITILMSLIYCEARFGKPKLRAGRYVMTSGWVSRVFVLPPAIIFGLIFCHVVYSYRPVGITQYCFYLLPGSFALGAFMVMIDTFVRRVSYDATGVELVAILAMRRRVFIKWSDIRLVSANFDKIKLTTESGRYTVYGHLKGCKAFMNQLRNECPNACIVGTY